jgi:benzoate 4-monooxygenase
LAGLLALWVSFILVIFLEVKLRFLVLNYLAFGTQFVFLSHRTHPQLDSLYACRYNWSVCCLFNSSFLLTSPTGDLAFGSPFGMLHAAKDSAQIPTSQKAAMDSYALHTSPSSSQTSSTMYTTTSIPAVQILNDRGEFAASLGVLPPWWRPLVKRFIPWYRRGAGAVKNLAGIAVVAVAKRLSMDKEHGMTHGGRVDLLSKLREGKDDDGNPMGREELTAEALTQLIAGSDTTSKSVFFFSITEHALAHII